MSETVLLKLIEHGPAILAAIASIVAAIASLRVRREVKEVHNSINGKLEEIVAVNRSDAERGATLVERDRGEAIAADLAAKHEGTKT